MAASSSNNVIKISSNNNSISLDTTFDMDYPRTCDFCRDTYNTELTFQRHKETGKCFRFCRLREEMPDKFKKAKKPSLYPRRCERCFKMYKNKHSFCKHKRRCWIAKKTPSTTPSTKDESVPSTSQLSNTDVDVVELSKDDIENIPITENKENIDDFDSKFILTIDMDKNAENFNSLYPRICNVCHKIFKCKESFNDHKIYCKPVGIQKTRESIYPKRCEACNRLLRNRQLAYAHLKKCGNPQSNRNANTSLRKINVDNEQCNKEPNYLENPEYVKPQPNSIYPRLCKYCGFVFNTKFAFHRHRKKCFGFVNIAKLNPEDNSTFIKCDHCSRTFNNAFQYRHHMRLIHPQAKIKRIMNYSSHITYPRTCSKCGKTYLSRQTFCNHKRKCFQFCAAKLTQSEASNEDVPDPNAAGSDTEFDEMESISNIKMNENSIAENGVEVVVLSEKKITYPRTCHKCFRTYSNPQSFCNHKKQCPKVTYEMDGYISDEQPSVYDINVTYPRECEYCQRIYASKQSFCNHKQHCGGYNKNLTISEQKSMYPRSCEFCQRIYNSKQSFHNHNKICAGQLSKPNDGTKSDSDMDTSDFTDQSPPDQQFQTKNVKGKIAYPRMCQFCRKIYASRQTFHKHKIRCKPIPPEIECDIYSASCLLEEPFKYPRECENCFGTFKCAETFNAHKIRCDFFETNIEDKDINIFMQSNCEHCHNILQQYRRIFHQHLSQCDDPIVIPREKLFEAHKTLPLSLSPTNSFFNQHDAFVNSLSESVDLKLENCAVNFCECCGVFFESAQQLEEHKRSVEMTHAAFCNIIVSDLDPEKNDLTFTCDVCSEDFESEECFKNHKLKCLVKSGGKIYPRFCECCQKVMKTKQVFYNHKKNCHIYCFKYFVQKDCEICLKPFRCEKMFLEHIKTCVKFDNGEVGAECEVTEGQCNR